jgi:hypothetical protein
MAWAARNTSEFAFNRRQIHYITNARPDLVSTRNLSSKVLWNTPELDFIRPTFLNLYLSEIPELLR